MNQNHEIYDIEPDSTLDQIKKLFTNISSEFSLYHLSIEGGNEKFYDMNGGKALRIFVDKVKKRLFEQQQDLGIYLIGTTNQFGDLYIVTKKKPEEETLEVLNEDDKTLEVRLAVSEVE